MISCYNTGVFTGKIIRMISYIRTKYGKDSANLKNCGKFTLALANDLSDISDMRSIDVSGFASLHVGSQSAFDFLCNHSEAIDFGDLLMGWVIKKYKEGGNSLVEVKGVPEDITGAIDVLGFAGADLKLVDLSGRSDLRGEGLLSSHASICAARPYSEHSAPSKCTPVRFFGKNLHL